MAGESYFTVLTMAINDMAEHGFDSAERVEYWQRRLRETANATLASDVQMETWLRDALQTVYRRLVEGGQISRFHAGIDRFTLDRIKPHLRGELDRRILAAADLIRLNKKQAVEKTLQRFTGWSTSIPAGGTPKVNRQKEKDNIRKSLKALPYEERRVLIDQGHKLTASINDIVAKDGGAIAAIWHSHFRQAGYDYRPDHKERDGHLYLIKGSWAASKGLLAVGKYPWSDSITQPGEEVFCRCWFTYVYNINKLPQDALSVKGRAELARVRAAR